jgi:hypothetical protein
VPGCAGNSMYMQRTSQAGSECAGRQLTCLTTEKEAEMSAWLAMMVAAVARMSIGHWTGPGTQDQKRVE